MISLNEFALVKGQYDMSRQRMMELASLGMEQINVLNARCRELEDMIKAQQAVNDRMQLSLVGYLGDKNWQYDPVSGKVVEL